MHTKLIVLLLLAIFSVNRTVAATISIDTPLSREDVASLTWPKHTVQELAAGDRQILVVCRAVGSGLMRRHCFLYYWNATSSEWLSVLAFHSSTSRVDATYVDGKIVLKSYAGRVLLELTAETLEPYYDPGELKGPRTKGAADEETLRRTEHR
jgi:hypothetical protein